MRTDDVDYHLPPEAIAQQPAARRDQARLLVDRHRPEDPRHHVVADLPELLSPGDLLVRNTTRVLPARLLLRKATGGKAEVLLLEPTAPDRRRWAALVRPGRRLPPGTRLRADEHGLPAPFGEVEVVVGEHLDDGQRVVEIEGLPPAGDPAGVDLEDLLAAVGELPLPPYITEPLAEPDRYQTVFADRATSVAAPTAGLHLTDEVLARCVARGIGVADVELSVGLATFRPIAADDVDDHRMHTERYTVPATTLRRCAEVRSGGGAVVAIGTTVVRALESAALTEPTNDAPDEAADVVASTDLFIRPGHRFALVDRLLTNFHLPRSSLLVLLEAFVGERWRHLYDVALAEGYRFLSFGDAMLVDRAEWPAAATTTTSERSDG
ncbi:MAG: tRNA preQ1(34) S-adenosylmethionine ribosyltransferase-isomerase QueA [Acidimicrobiia bacterium]|nr:tRNA preQ1(34) S-adenosylmethionine ribosyltransferase-isomerase QueA [Acidimicrobiia bacterium]